MSEEDSQTVNEIVAKMRLSRTAVQNILAKLTEDGMVIEREKRSSTRQGGKRAASYAISPDYKYSIFIYVSANNAIAELNNFALTLSSTGLRICPGCPIRRSCNSLGL